MGVCSGGLCASPGCGNDVVDSGEECDDGQNGDNDDGCRDDCTFSCHDDSELSGINPGAVKVVPGVQIEKQGGGKGYRRFKNPDQQTPGRRDEARGRSGT